MKEIILDCSMMTTTESAHQYIKGKLNFPDYYGGNLDALWDVLSTISNPIKITITNENSLKLNLEDYSEKLLAVFTDASDENENLVLNIE